MPFSKKEGLLFKCCVFATVFLVVLFTYCLSKCETGSDGGMRCEKQFNRKSYVLRRLINKKVIDPAKKARPGTDADALAKGTSELQEDGGGLDDGGLDGGGLDGGGLDVGGSDDREPRNQNQRKDRSLNLPSGVYDGDPSDPAPLTMARKRKSDLFLTRYSSSEPIQESDMEEGVVDDNNTAPTERDAYCGICLGTYEHGENISWSHNPSCWHVFHTECVVGWLVRRKTCPFCREDYLRA